MLCTNRMKIIKFIVEYRKNILGFTYKAHQHESKIIVLRVLYKIV
jgi:hypothetical protein